MAKYPLSGLLSLGCLLIILSFSSNFFRSSLTHKEMWTSKVISLQRGNTQKYSIFAGGSQLSFRQAIDGWKTNGEFRSFYTSLLTSSPFTAAFWETPPLTSAQLDAPYEFVLVKADALESVRADQHTFQEHFRAGKRVVVFDNIRGDSRLVSPTPNGSSDYAHLLSFLRSAPEAQAHAFWETIASEFGASVGEETKWLSTSGLGIYWVHARIDPRPKYYTFDPYRSASYKTSSS